jgi:hypothetical protein
MRERVRDEIQLHTGENAHATAGSSMGVLARVTDSRLRLRVVRARPPALDAFVAKLRAAKR